MTLLDCQDCQRVNVRTNDNNRLFCAWCDSPRLVSVSDELPFGQPERERLIVEIMRGDEQDGIYQVENEKSKDENTNDRG